MRKINEIGVALVRFAGVELLAPVVLVKRILEIIHD